MFKKVSASLLALVLAASCLTAGLSFSAMKSRVYDDFERSSLGVTEPGNTGAGVEPDDTWVHNPDGFVVYWIQYNTATKLSIDGGALKFDASGEGWAGFGMTGDFADRDYDSFTVRLKGAKGGEQSALYFNVQGAYRIDWDNARDPDGNPLPAITTDYKDYTISLANSGMGETKGQRNIMAKGWTDFHINSTAACTVYVDKITQVQTKKYSDPVAPAPTPEASAAPSSEPAAATSTAPSEAPSITPEEPSPSEEPEPSDEPALPVSYPNTDRDKDNSYLVDDFNRASLLLDPELEVAPGGPFGGMNSDDNIIYWIQWNDATFPEISNPDGVLKLKTTGAGWYGTASDPAYLDTYNCLAFRIKGESGGEDALLTLNPDTLGGKHFNELLAPDGSPLPAITTEWQTLVIDIVKSGWKGLPEKEFYQNIHLNTDGACTVYIDEIYFTNVAGAGVEAPPPPEPTAELINDAFPSPVQDTPPAPSPTPTAGDNKPASKLPLFIILAVVIVGAVVGAVALITRKK